MDRALTVSQGEVLMFLPLLVVIPLLASPGTASDTSIQCPAGMAGKFVWREHEHAALAAFDRSVQDYADLHRRLAITTPPLMVTADPAELLNAVATLREAIQRARPTAQRGDVFTEPAAHVFRQRIECALWRFDVAALVAEMGEDEEPGATPPVVNRPFPWSSGNAIWPSVLAALPPLPPELEYRFVGADLVLIDIPANLVVDVLPGALPVPGS